MMKTVAVILCVSTFWAQVLHVQSSPRVGSRIIGGDTASTGQFPFAAAIYKSTNLGTFFCSGALINDQWIVTAAECVADAVLFTIRLGSTSLTSNDPNSLRLATDQYVSHPDFNPDTLEHDIALIKLRMAITFTDYIKPINVLSSTPLPDSSSVITLGWGQISDSQAGLVDHLYYVFLVTLSNEECRLAFGNQITDNMVCVDGNYNEGTCKGDLGAALVQLGGTSIVYHVGISSFVSTNGCESTDPSGFTRTAPYVDWINNVTATY